MNEHALPDDLSRWPSNPFELLSVVPGISERDLRRAYARLIRVYKPEQFPEHFRRIREAYETLRQYAQFFPAFEPPAASSDASTNNPAPAQPVLAPAEAADPDTPAAERLVPPARPRSFEEELDEAWDWAIAGDEARAYARLFDLQDRYPARAEACLRLHCLLSVAPELDPRREPCDFLAQGLRRTGSGGPCHEVYRRAIEDEPAEALTERFGELLDATSQPGLLVTFAQWRWSAAGRLGRFDVIGDDLPGLRTRFVADQEEIWLRLLAFAADQLAWDPAGSAGLRECLHETARHKHLELRCGDVFDRLEYLERASAGWHSLVKEGTVPRNLLELLSRFWIRPFAEIRRHVTALLAAVVATSAGWLAYLDRLNEASPHLLALFGQMLDSYQATVNPAADPREPEELAELARRFLEEHSDLDHPALRPRLLAFCLREWIDPEVIVQLGHDDPALLPEHRLNHFINDWPLRGVYRACALFLN